MRKERAADFRGVNGSDTGMRIGYLNNNGKPNNNNIILNQSNKKINTATAEEERIDL